MSTISTQHIFNEPLVSVGLPVYNGGNYLDATLKALLSQSYKNVEIIISDNASTDNTREICQKFMAKYEQVKYYRNDINKGAVNNFNRVLALSTGKYFMWSGHDDIYLPDFIKACVAELEKESNLSFCSTGLQFINEHGELIEPFDYSSDNPDLSYGDLSSRLMRWWSQPGWYSIYSLYRLDAIKSVNIKNIYGSDVVLITDLLLKGHLGGKVNKCLFLYRQFSGKTEQDRYESSVTNGKPLKHVHLDLCESLSQSIYESQLPRKQTKALIKVLMNSWKSRLSSYAIYALWHFIKNGLHDNALELSKIMVTTVLKRAVRFATFIRNIPKNIINILWYIFSISQIKEKRCAVVEYNNHHDEVLPSVVFYLAQLGFKVDLITTTDVFEKKIFDVFSGNDRPSFSWFYFDKWGFTIWEKLFSIAKYEFIFLNSIEPEYILHKKYYSNIPVIAIMHNSNLLKNNAYKEFFIDEKKIPLSLSPVSYTYVNKNFHYNNMAWISPIYFFRKNHPKNKTVFCIQGNIDLSRRNYIDLINVVKNLISEGISYFSIAIVGKRTKDSDLLKNYIDKLDINKYFNFFESEKEYSGYYNVIQSCHFILPILDTTNNKYESYFNYKIPSAMGLIFGFMIIPVIHRKLAELYDIVDGSIIYEDNDLLSAMKIALLASPSERQFKQKILLQKKEDLIYESTQNIENIINSF